MLRRYGLRFAYEKKKCSVSIDTLQLNVASGYHRPYAINVVMNGRLFIQIPAADTAYIVTFDGRVYKTLSLSAGEYSEQMPQGSYIIHVGKRSYKLNF